MREEDLDAMVLAGMRCDPDFPYPADIPDEKLMATYAFRARRILAAYLMMRTEVGLPPEDGAGVDA